MADELKGIRQQVEALHEQFERTFQPFKELQERVADQLARAVEGLPPAREVARQLQEAVAALGPAINATELAEGILRQTREMGAGMAKTAEAFTAMQRALTAADPKWQESLRGLSEAAVLDAASLQELARQLQETRDAFVGRRSGRVTALAKQVGALEPSTRREAGGLVNNLKQTVESEIEGARAAIDLVAQVNTALADRIDISLPGRVPVRGRRHPLTSTREDLEDIFVSMGYEIYDGPEVDDDYHCFEALNMPPDHPARDMQDTFYLKDRPSLVLRTHTSPAQIRYMLSNSHPPRVRIICPGKVFRRDDDITHSPMFQQVEALVVGPGITVGDLKGTVEAFLHALFGPQFPVRVRPSYFPYTEPSLEFDLGCIVCGGKGCRVCKHTGWLEIMGSGMVHPAVFEAVNKRLGKVVYDPEKVTGFAFGLGIERVAMMRHGIDDIRLFYANDLRMLEQFPS